MNLTEPEFTVLRQTIATRGTARVILCPLTLLGWATVMGTESLHGDPTLAALISLVVLAAGFEAIHALHVGVERIGRYLQVFYEADGDGPRWETTTMASGTALPGGGVDPLFTVLFACAVAVNLVPGLMASPTPVELGVTASLHVALLVRLVRARGAAGRQRAVELESYRAMKSRGRS